MVAELGPSNVVDSSYEQVDLIPVPEDLKPLYEPYELVGVSWQMFLFMTTAERRLVHSHVGSLHEKTLLIEKQAVICKASQRISHTRSDCDSQILDWFAKNTVHTTFDLERAAATGYEPVLTIENHQDPYKDTTISSSAFPKDKPQTSSETTSSYSAPKVNRKFSGLVNQSSTCYLNALLQALFHLPVFRRTIYSMPVPENPNPKSSVSLAMQELFFNLERKKGKNKTTNLTAAFGWDSQEAAVQHDIHELVRKLLDVLEANYGSLPHGERNPIQRIFCGTKLYYSKCIDVDYTYQREETLYDVELVVKTHANIEESLKAETTAERLEGGNKYCWEHDDEPRDPVTNKYRKTYHDADRGSAFKELPPVLMIHPNRLDFDLTTFQKITVNSEWQFAETLDMSPYVIASEANPVANHVMLQRAQSTCPTEVDGAYSESTGMSRRETSAASTGGADTTDTTMTRPEHSGMGDATMTAPPENPYMYDLRSVVIHSGAASFGHYYCYVNDNGEWIKFNDETVTDTTFAAMCKEAFGGMTTTTSGYQYASSTRASLLVYVRRELKDTVLLDVTEEDIPPPLKAFFEEEQGREAKDAEEAARLASLCSVAIIRLDQSEKGFNELRLPRLATVSKLPPDQLISEGLEDCTLWLMDAYYNYTVHYRSTHYEAIKLNGTEKVGEKFPVPAYYSPNHVVSKVLIAVPHSVATPPPTLGDTPELSDWTRRLRGSTNPCLLVVYEYIRGQGIVYQSIVQTREELVRRYYPTEEEGLADKPQILIESQRKLYTVPDPQGLYGGDIVVLVRPSEGTDFDAVRAFNMMYNYLDVTVYRMRTSQLPVGVVIEEPEDAAGQHDVDQPTEIGTIRLVENDTFDDVQTAVADYLSDPSIDPKCIAFRSHDANADAPHKQLASRNSFDYYGHATGLRDVRGILGDRQGIMICKLYFEVLPMPVEKFEALGLRDYVAVRGTTRLRFVGRKPTSTSLYTEHMRDLRKLAADALGLSVNRVAIASVNYDGVTDSISMDPHEVTATPPPQPTSAAAASPSAAGTADEVYPTAEARDAESPAVGEPVTSPDAPPRGNDDDEWGQVRRGNGRRQTSSSNGTPSSSGRARGDPTDDSDDADAPYSKLHDNDQTATVESPAAQNPLTAGYSPSTLPTTQSTTTSAAASTAFASAVSSPRTDICVPYSKPTYMNLDSTYFIVVPEVPAAEPYVAPHEDDAAPALPPRWIFLVIQHCVNRSRKDFFGFACGVWVRDTDTGKVARGRILATLGVEEAAATNWKLLALKQSSSASMALVGDETKLSDVFNFNTTYFNGSLVLERPLPTGLATRNHRVASAEPELRINAPRNSASTQDVTSQQGAHSRP